MKIDALEKGTSHLLSIVAYKKNDMAIFYANYIKNKLSEMELTEFGKMETIKPIVTNYPILNILTYINFFN